MKQPFVVNIDVCGICNESCNYCPRSSSYPNIKEYMSIDLFQKFVDDSQGYNGYICFTGRGENSLHPKFKQLVEILHHENRTYKTRILTNGYKLKDKFYWFNQFDSIIMNTYSSKEEMEERKKILPRAKHRYWDQSLRPEDWGETPVQVQNRTELYERIATDRTEQHTPCLLPYYRCWIHHNGDVELCCNDWTDTNVYGNFADTPWLEIWRNNEELKRLRQELLRGNRKANDVCRNCNRKVSDNERRKFGRLLQKSASS